MPAVALAAPVRGVARVNGPVRYTLLSHTATSLALALLVSTLQFWSAPVVASHAAVRYRVTEAPPLELAVVMAPTAYRYPPDTVMALTDEPAPGASAATSAAAAFQLLASSRSTRPVRAWEPVPDGLTVAKLPPTHSRVLPDGSRSLPAADRPGFHDDRSAAVPAQLAETFTAAA